MQYCTELQFLGLNVGDTNEVTRFIVFVDLEMLLLETNKVILRINILRQRYKMERLRAHVTLNPLVSHLATTFFVTKIFTVRRTVIITFITAALISITYQLLQVLPELQTRSSLSRF